MYKWTTKTGKKPTKQELKIADEYARHGTQVHTVLAMALRPNGLTQQEVITLLGHPHRNKLRQLVQSHKVRKVVLDQPQRIRLFKV